MPINAGDAAWMLVANASVLFMMPGLALFYGGLVGRKNVNSSMAQSYVAIGVVSVLWVVVGYSLAFGPNHGGVVYPFVMTFAILWITEKTVGLRVSPNEQAMGLDESDIGEKAYVPEINQEMTRCFQTT